MTFLEWILNKLRDDSVIDQDLEQEPIPLVIQPPPPPIQEEKEKEEKEEEKRVIIIDI